MNTLETIATRPIGPRANGMLMTPEEFDATTEWDPDYRYELVHGVLIVTPPADIGERDPNGELEFLLRLYKYNHPRGTCLDKTVSEETVSTSAGRRRMGRAIWCGLGRHPHEGDVPTVAVEFGFGLVAESATGPASGLRGQAAGISGDRRPGILGDRPVSAPDDGVSGRRRGGRGRTGCLLHGIVAGI